MNTGQTGPRTREGKQRSSLNALKHGLTATSAHAISEIAEQCEAPFDDILAQMNRHYQPRDPVERQLVMRIARCVWRLSLSAAMERRVIGNFPNPHRPSSSYDRILKFERLVDIHLHRALTTLYRKRELERPSPKKTTRKTKPTGLPI
jgi:hypothetical protein